MDFLSQFYLFLASLVANFFSALAGGGAGLIQLPVIIFLGLPFSIALATHKVASVALGLGATLRHLQENNLIKQFILLMIIAGVPGVITGASFILKVPEVVSLALLGFLTCFIGIYSYFQKNFGLTQNFKHLDTNGVILGGIVLFFLGMLNGSLTSGTGLFVTIWLVKWFGFDYKTAIAHTLVLVGIVWNGTGAITLGILGNIAWDWLPALLLGSFIGGYFGAALAIKKGNTFIKRFFEVITLLVGLSLLFKAFLHG